MRVMSHHEAKNESMLDYNNCVLTDSEKVTTYLGKDSNKFVNFGVLEGIWSTKKLKKKFKHFEHIEI